MILTSETGRDPGLTVLSCRDPHTPSRFADSVLRTGFGVLTDHPFPPELFQGLYEEWLHFFLSDAKRDHAVLPGHQAGFFSTRAAETAKGETRRDLKEYFHLFRSGSLPAGLSTATRRYFDEVSAFAGRLLGWLEDALPADVRARLSMPLSDMIVDSDATLLRILHYPPLADASGEGMRAAAHEDINLITILPAASEAGLQLLRADGSWLDVPGASGTLIVNVGDMLQEATDGYFRSTTHRVVNPSGMAAARSRLSIPLFLQPRGEVVLSARHTAASYLTERLAELRAGTQKSAAPQA